MPAQIHPTAIVDPGAGIGADVVIGPYCVVGDKVVIGDGCTLQNHVTLCGPAIIGKGNQFFAYTSIGQRTQDLKYAGEPTHLEIGDDNVFREFCTVNRGTLPGTKTAIGSHNHFLAYCHIAHDCVVGSHVIFSNNGTLAGHVTVEDHVILGGLTAVHQFCRLGTSSLCSMFSYVTKDVPAYVIVSGRPGEPRGINTEGLKRRDFSAAEIRSIREAYRAVYRRGLNLEEVVELLEQRASTEPVLTVFVESLRAGSRGLIR
jgi:UDP-N-acetylglucosamine acyltransferase